MNHTWNEETISIIDGIEESTQKWNKQYSQFRNLIDQLQSLNRCEEERFELSQEFWIGLTSKLESKIIEELDLLNNTLHDLGCKYNTLTKLLHDLEAHINTQISAKVQVSPNISSFLAHITSLAQVVLCLMTMYQVPTRHFSWNGLDNMPRLSQIHETMKPLEDDIKHIKKKVCQEIGK